MDMALFTALLVVGCLAVIGGLATTRNRGGWFAEVAADIDTDSKTGRADTGYTGRLYRVSRVIDTYAKYVTVLTLAGIFALGQVAVILFSELLSALLFGLYTGAVVAWDHQDEIWTGVRKAGYYLKEATEFLAAVLTIASAGLLGAVYHFLKDWWR